MHQVHGIALAAQVLDGPRECYPRLRRQRRREHNSPSRLLPCTVAISRRALPIITGLQHLIISVDARQPQPQTLPGMRLLRSSSLPTFSDRCRCSENDGELLMESMRFDQ